jgi:hypothetical protein
MLGAWHDAATAKLAFVVQLRRVAGAGFSGGRVYRSTAGGVSDKPGLELRVGEQELEVPERSGQFRQLHPASEHLGSSWDGHPHRPPRMPSADDLPAVHQLLELIGCRDILGRPAVIEDGGLPGVLCPLPISLAQELVEGTDRSASR